MSGPFAFGRLMGLRGVRSMAVAAPAPVGRRFCWPQGVALGVLVVSDDEDDDYMDES